jgi:tetratricopeptide (TPR) repeat protein
MDKDRIKIYLIISLGFILFSSSILGAQDSKFRGTIKDEDGNPIPNGKIILTLITRNFSFDFKSNKKGKFYRRGIEPGEYMLAVEVEGYKPFKQKIYISVGQEYKMDIIMAKSVSDKALKIIETKNKFDQGVQLYQQGKFEEAIEAFEDVITSKPDFAEGYYNLGMACLRQGDSDRAIEVIHKAIELKPDFIEAYFGIGKAYIDKGEEEQATEIFKKAVAINPNDAKIYVNLGALYFSANRDDLAMEAFFKAMELDPSLPNTYYQMGLLYYKKQKIDESIKSFEKYLELAPQSPDAESVKAIIEELRKKRDSVSISIS